MNYIILSTGRARSGVLCNYLRQLKCGMPDEFYERVRFDLYTHTNHDNVADWLEDYRDNGILGMRIVFSHIRTMHNSLGLTLKEFIDTFLIDAHYILHTRDPHLQAIESQLYEIDKGKRDRFCHKTMKNRVAKIVIQECAYRKFFQKNGIKPIIVDGNKLEKCPMATMKKVIHSLGYDAVTNFKSRFHDAYMNAERDKIYNSVFKGFV